MMDLDLNLLRVFSELMQTRSVTSAARKLGLSQPATSHALARLREHFDDELLVRGSKGMLPTARAQRLYPAVRSALEQLEAAIMDAPTFDPKRAERRFHLATEDFSELVILPRLLPVLALEGPSLDLFVHRIGAPGKLEEGSIDLALTPYPSKQGAGLRVRALFDESFVVLMRKGHPLSRRKLTLESYADAHHALIAPRGTLGGIVDDLLEKKGLSRRVALAVPHFLALPHVLSESDLLCTIPTRVARCYSELLPLHLAEPPLNVPPFTMSMVWHERSDREPGNVWLRTLLWRLFGGRKRR